MDFALMCDLICSDPLYRRELLWLRAKEKEDEEQVADLEGVDPFIRRRLEAAGFDLEQTDGEGFGRLYDERWNQLEAMLDAVFPESDASLAER